MSLCESMDGRLDSEDLVSKRSKRKLMAGFCPSRSASPNKTALWIWSRLSLSREHPRRRRV